MLPLFFYFFLSLLFVKTTRHSHFSRLVSFHSVFCFNEFPAYYFSIFEKVDFSKLRKICLGGMAGLLKEAEVRYVLIPSSLQNLKYIFRNQKNLVQLWKHKRGINRGSRLKIDINLDGKESVHEKLFSSNQW